jgi:flagellar basal body-associated protein FliL
MNKITTTDKLIAYLTLISGLSISAVAVWYSVAGLVSIFAAAAVPIMIMGVVLEVSKLIATLWLKINWKIAPKLIRTYLIIAITILMLITSMGIFGFLSKAHLDQAVPTGDIADKVALYDDKIKTQKENIDAARKALKQMDEAVDQIMARSTDEKGADKAAALRRSQQKERTNLQNDISKAQTTITGLNEQRAPIAKELRQVEAEVGPIKYIAALLYGDNPDTDLLEKAVRAVIIIIVIVFDPLAVVMLLASQYSFQWFRKEREDAELKDVVETVPTEPESDPEGEPTPNQHEPAASAFWPFPSSAYNLAPSWGTTPVHTEEVQEPIAEEPAPTPVEEAVIEDSAIDEIDDENDENDSEELKTAKAQWKHDHPDSSLKLQRKLYEKGVIKKLPWEDYLKPQADFSDDEAAAEAAKWAQEQLDKHTLDERPGDYIEDVESKKKDSELDGTSGQITSDQNFREVGYTQNAEQTQSTLWNKLKQAKE